MRDKIVDLLAILKVSIFLKIILIVFFLALILVSISLFFILKKPSNNRNWDVGFDKLPKITINNNLVSVINLRDFKYNQSGIARADYTNRVLNTEKLEKVWFVVQPFGDSKPIAHTFFVFDFEGEDPIVISVEARREVGEKYDGYLGALNKFELIYVWSTETDQMIRRAIIDNNKLYMYPLNISKHGGQQLLLQLASKTQKLETEPRFYNTLLNNCTNELAKAANKVKPNTIPLHYAQIMPGYSTELLYDLKLIPNDRPLEEITEKYYVTETVNNIYLKPDFSTRLRLNLN